MHPFKIATKYNNVGVRYEKPFHAHYIRGTFLITNNNSRGVFNPEDARAATMAESSGKIYNFNGKTINWEETKQWKPTDTMDWFPGIHPTFEIRRLDVQLSYIRNTRSIYTSEILRNCLYFYIILLFENYLMVRFLSYILKWNPFCFTNQFKDTDRSQIKLLDQQRKWQIQNNSEGSDRKINWNSLWNLAKIEIDSLCKSVQSCMRSV